jgi:hypothetical protein
MTITSLFESFNTALEKEKTEITAKTISDEEGKDIQSQSNTNVSKEAKTIIRKMPIKDASTLNRLLYTNESRF